MSAEVFLVFSSSAAVSLSMNSKRRCPHDFPWMILNAFTDEIFSSGT